ncbi:MAG: hypothetical protein R6W92_14365 [Desulfocurvibacter africanus]
MTADAMVGDREACRRDGWIYVAKPVELRDLEQALQAAHDKMHDK